MTKSGLQFHPDEALTHVWAEAGSDVEARRTAQEYVERIRQVLR